MTKFIGTNSIFAESIYHAMDGSETRSSWAPVTYIWYDLSIHYNDCISSRILKKTYTFNLLNYLICYMDILLS